MDFTKALDELKRVKEFLSAVAISEETMRQVATLSDEIARLGKDKAELESAISRLGPEYTAAKKAHDVAMGRLSSEKQSAQDGLVAVQKEIAASKKAFRQEAEAHAALTDKARKDHAATLSEMHKEIEQTQLKLDSLKDRIKKIDQLAG